MIKITYCKDGTNNWGDYIAPVLVEYISGQKTQYIKSEDFVEDEDVYALVGSILSWQQKRKSYRNVSLYIHRKFYS